MTMLKNYDTTGAQKKFYQKKWFKITLSVVIVLVIVFGVIAWKTGGVINKISSGGILNSIAHSIPGTNNELKGEKDGRVNILLLGMRGADDPAGGNLSDSIEVLSLQPKENKVSLISVPRDLFVDNPVAGYKTKLNAVYALGEKDGAKQGLANAEKVISDVTGLIIPYGVSVNYDAFTQVINAVGGVEITLDKPFEESMQFDQPHVCDTFFTKPTGKYENKTTKYFSALTKTYKTRIVKSYPLCTAPVDTLECGGDFKLPAGKQTLDAKQALCYARSRETSNDFERARRQQEIIQALKNKLLSLGTLTDFTKLNNILNSLGDNVKTDMQAWEMKRLYDIHGQMKDYTMYQRVMDESDNAEAGLLYGVADPTSGDILLPKGDNYDRIHNLFQNIFTLSPQPK